MTILKHFIILCSPKIIKALLRNHLSVFIELIDSNKKNVNKTSIYGNTVLIFASRDIKLITYFKILIDNGANINAANYIGATPLILSIIGNNNEYVKILLENNVNVNCYAKNGFSALMVAIVCENFESIKLLLSDSKININYQSKKGESALLFACIHNNWECVDMLLKNGVDQSLLNKHKYYDKLLQDYINKSNITDI